MVSDRVMSRSHGVALSLALSHQLSLVDLYPFAARFLFVKFDSAYEA
jgi:hypothetical protein